MNQILGYFSFNKDLASEDDLKSKVLLSVIKDNNCPVSFDDEFRLAPSYGDYSERLADKSDYVLSLSKDSKYIIMAAMIKTMYWGIVADFEETAKRLSEKGVDLYQAIDDIIEGKVNDQVYECLKHEPKAIQFEALRIKSISKPNTAILVSPVVSTANTNLTCVRMHYSLEREINFNISIHLLRIAKLLDKVATSIAFEDNKIYLQCPEKNADILKQLITESNMNYGLKCNLCERNTQ